MQQICEQAKEVFITRKKSQQFPLINLDQAQPQLLFTDQKTQQLYSTLTQLCHNQRDNQFLLDDDMMKQAASITKIKSYLSKRIGQLKGAELKESLKRSFVVDGVRLKSVKDNKQASLDLKNKSYSIVDYKASMKCALTSQQFKQLEINHVETQIVYAYDFNHNHNKSKESNKKTQEFQSKQLDQTIVISTPSSKKKKRSKMTIFVAQKKMNSTSSKSDQVVEKGQYSFKQFGRSTDGKRRKQISYNMFNICDFICNSYPDENQLGMKVTKMSLVEPKVKEKLWDDKIEKLNLNLK